MTRDEILRNTTCGDCLHFLRAPDEWARRDFGMCAVDYDWVEADMTLRRSGCECFEATPGFEVTIDADWKEGLHDWDE